MPDGAPRERVGLRIGAFVAGLVVVFGAAFGIGRAVGPWDAGRPASPMPPMPGMTTTTTTAPGDHP